MGRGGVCGLLCGSSAPSVSLRCVTVFGACVTGRFPSCCHGFFPLVLAGNKFRYFVHAHMARSLSGDYARCPRDCGGCVLSLHSAGRKVLSLASIHAASPLSTGASPELCSLRGPGRVGIMHPISRPRPSVNPGVSMGHPRR
jgi:hypothetical protein